MQKSIYILPRLDERYLLLQHESGLRAVLVHKDFYSSYGLLCVPFGSVFEDCLVGKERLTLPRGSAHFLEHKMFDNPDGVDAFNRFASCGADTNAYTGYDRTCYLFSTTESVEEALEVLFECVLTPYFTEKSVKREKGIILQELKMYRDDAGERISSALLGAMYDLCPVKKDICGSISSVKSVRASDLYAAYEHFYTPERMMLVLCGKFDEARVEALIEKHFAGKKAKTPPAVRLPENDALPVRVKKQNHVYYTDITTPVLSIGIKLAPAANGDSAAERQKRFYELCILAYSLFSPGCAYVSGLNRDNLLPGDSSYDVVYTEYYAHVLFESVCYRPGEAIARFNTHMARIAREGISEEDFERAKKILYSELLDSFNSSEAVAHFYLSDLFDGFDSCEKVDLLSGIKREQVNETARAALKNEAVTRLTTLPLSAKKGNVK